MPRGQGLLTKLQRVAAKPQRVCSKVSRVAAYEAPDWHCSSHLKPFRVFKSLLCCQPLHLGLPGLQLTAQGGVRAWRTCWRALDTPTER